MRRLRNREPAELSYREITPPAYEQPAARLRQLDATGVDAAVLFPNYGLGWELELEADQPAQQANLALGIGGPSTLRAKAADVCCPSRI